jgi:hypothetical protein
MSRRSRAPTVKAVRFCDQRGQTSAEYLGGLLLVAAIIGAVVLSGAHTAIAGHTERLVCKIAGGDCQEAEAEPRPDVQPAVGGPDQGPPLTGGEIEVLPFPGSVTVTCTVSENPKLCKGPSKPHVTVSPSASTTIERTPTKLNAKGCPQQTLSVSTTFKVEVAGGANTGGEKPTASGKLKAFLGAQTKYAITVRPEQAEAIEHGQRKAPNPLDPSTIGVGENIQMSEEFYANLGLSAEYRALQVDLGYDKGRRVSSGVTRLNDSHIRVYVGDEDFVRQALAFGVGGSGAKISASFNKELSDGKLKALDININTPEGWNAYQQFVTTGHLPDAGTAGVSRPTESTTHRLSDSAKIEAELGQWKLGGQLKDAEGNIVDTRNQDGSHDSSFSIRYNDVGLELTEHLDPSGNRVGDRTYALNLEGVRPDVYSNFQKLNFNDPTPPPDGNVRWEFTRSDLLGIREQALNTLAAQAERDFGVHPRLSAQEVADILERNNGRFIYGPHDAEFHPQPPVVGLLANMRTPEEVLEALYRLAGGDPNGLLTGPLTDFTLAVNHSLGERNPSERNRLPGSDGIRGPANCGGGPS